MGCNFSGLYPVEKSPQRLNKKMRDNSAKFNWTGIDFPVSPKEINKFEKQNDYGICVITYDERKGFGVGNFCEKDIDKSKIIDLLLISDKDDNTHYCWIKDISKLLSRQVANSNGKRYFCRRCFTSFGKEETLGTTLR